MAFISKQHSLQNFAGDLQTPVNSLPLWYGETSLSFFDNFGITMPPEYDVTTSFSRSSSWKTSFPERFGVSEMAVPTSPEITTTALSSMNLTGSDEYICSSGGYVANSWSSYPTATNNWEIESQKTSKEIEEPTLKIGRYSMEERKDKIMRYLKKRNQRNFNKTIKYECRKTLADKRIRVRGRFAKNNNDHHHHHHDHHQPCEDQVLPNIITANNPCEEDIQQLFNNNFMMKKDYDEEEEWLHEAMASLLYSPYINIPNN